MHIFGRSRTFHLSDSKTVAASGPSLAYQGNVCTMKRSISLGMQIVNLPFLRQKHELNFFDDQHLGGVYKKQFREHHGKLNGH